MHKYFPDWYRAAGLNPTAETLEKRWRAVEGFNKKIKVPNALELVRLYFDRPTIKSDFSEQYSAVFQAQDPTFSTRDNSVELRVLAGASIANIVETTRTVLTDAIALAMVCGFCRGLRQKVLNGEIIESARHYLADESVTVRSVDGFNIKTPDTDLVKLLNALTSASTGSNLATIKEHLAPPFEKLAAAVAYLSTSVNDMGNRYSMAANVSREESNILWWVFGEHSRDLKKPISDLKLPFAALVCGKELADLTRIIPGPLSSEAFLRKMLSFSAEESPSSSISIKDAIGAATTEWRKDLLETSEMSQVEDFCVVHIAVQKSLDSNTASQWRTSFDKSTGIKSGTSLDPVALAMQMCDERMLIRAAVAASAR